MAEPRLYRPAWFLRLFVRLEDFGTADTSDAQPSTAPYATKTKAIESQIDANETAIAQEEVATVLGNSRGHALAERLRAANTKLEAQKNKQTGRSAVDKAGPGDSFSVQFVTVPSEMEIEDRGFREAAQLTATFPFADMPLDPRIIRECRVEGWLGTVNAADFGTPDNWHLKPAADFSKTCVLRFNGYIDLPEMEHDDSDSKIHIKARSFEAVLIDGKINPHAPAYRMQQGKDDEPITAYVNRILSQYPPTSGDAGGDPFRCVWYGDPTKEPKLGRKTLLRSLQTAKSRNLANGAQPGQEPPPQIEGAEVKPDPTGAGDSASGGQASMPGKSVTPDGMSIWDLITQACELAGCMPLYQPSLPPFPLATGQVTTVAGVVTPQFKMVQAANYLILAPPQAFLEDITSSRNATSGTSRDGFQRTFQDDAGAWDTDIRFMVWGHNVKSMKMSRKMGRTRPTGVEVRAYNPDASATLRVMSARFPPKGTIEAKAIAGVKTGKKGATKMTAKGGGKVEVFRTFLLQGIRDQHALEQAAVSIYHQLTRAELSIELETDELSSYMDPDASLRAQSLVKCENDDPDLMRLCAGTPVRVTVAAQSEGEDNLVISSLSDFYGSKGANIADLLQKQNERWALWLNADGQQNIQAVDQVAQRIQAAYDAARLPDIFYVRSIKLNCNADAEASGFKATMELVNYMPDNDPNLMDDDTKAMNDDRKIKKKGKASVKQSAQDKATQKIVDDVELETLMGSAR